MAVDTPAVIAVIGAGPIGLEAALYARFLGYEVRVYERSRAVEQLLTAADAEPAAASRCGTSPLGIAALAAQTPGWKPPDGDALRSPAQWAAEYFQPLARTDLLIDAVLEGAEVLSIERDSAGGVEPAADDEVPGFRLQVRDASGERIDTADVVIDASGRAAPPFGFDPAESDFYVLGAKSRVVPGRFYAAGEFRFADGLAQIRELFKIIADRAGLDLYATIGGRG